MPAPQPRPKYILKGPREELVVTNVYSKESGGPLEYKPVEERKPCWMLYMPTGPNGEMNSIRITNGAEQLRELGIDPDFTPLIDEDGNVVGSFANRVNQDYGPAPILDKKKGA